MDDSQLQELESRSYNKYDTGKPAVEDKWADPFAELDALKAREARIAAGEDENEAATPKAVRVRKAKVRSKKFKHLKHQVDRSRAYKASEAIKSILELSKEAFDATIELNLELKRDAMSGEISLPHGTGKQTRVEIFSDALVEKIEKKQLDFDILLAKPADMGKIAKYARVLGPKGLMPNPKNGTITPDPETRAKELTAGGKISFKTEKKAPLVHLAVGKRSQGPEKVQENLTAVFKAINPRQVKKAFLATSMGPGIRLDIASLEVATV